MHESENVVSKRSLVGLMIGRLIAVVAGIGSQKRLVAMTVSSS